MINFGEKQTPRYIPFCELGRDRTWFRFFCNITNFETSRRSAPIKSGDDLELMEIKEAIFVTSETRTCFTVRPRSALMRNFLSEFQKTVKMAHSNQMS